MVCTVCMYVCTVCSRGHVVLIEGCFCAVGECVRVRVEVKLRDEVGARGRLR